MKSIKEVPDMVLSESPMFSTECYTDTELSIMYLVSVYMLII